MEIEARNKKSSLKINSNLLFEEQDINKLINEDDEIKISGFEHLDNNNQNQENNSLNTEGTENIVTENNEDKKDKDIDDKAKEDKKTRSYFRKTAFNKYTQKTVKIDVSKPKSKDLSLDLDNEDNLNSILKLRSDKKLPNYLKFLARKTFQGTFRRSSVAQNMVVSLLKDTQYGDDLSKLSKEPNQLLKVNYNLLNYILLYHIIILFNLLF